MDKTGTADGAYRMLNPQRQAETIRTEPPPLPNHGPYRVIVADPPWPYDNRQNDASHRGALPYPSMTIEEICAVPLPQLAHKHCVLWLWTTNHFMPYAYQVLEAWGFEHKTILTWDKDKIGLGDWLRGQTEHCILAVRGHPTVTLTGQSTLLRAAAGEHSAKPDAFYDLTESVCPAPRYASLFHRGPSHPLWDAHGDEIGNQEAANTATPVQLDLVEEIARLDAPSSKTEAA
jgi:N6-adenosine-specific RNA methylase IME4